MSDNPIDLALLARQQARLLEEQGGLRDDMSVMMAMLQRIDGTLSGLVNELRATHRQQARLDRRVRALEAPTTTEA